MLQLYLIWNCSVGVNFMEKSINLRNTEITFSIWDLGGQREFISMLPLGEYECRFTLVVSSTFHVWCNYKHVLSAQFVYNNIHYYTFIASNRFLSMCVCLLVNCCLYAVCNDAVTTFFMFDLSRKSTLLSIKEWYRQARGLNRVSRRRTGNSKMPLIIA